MFARVGLVALIAALQWCGPTKEDTGAPGDCEDLDVEACDEDDTCELIDGRPLEDDGAGGVCVDWAEDRVDLGCMDFGLGCDEAEHLASSPDDPDTCWWFGSGCLPTGWTECDWVDVGECAR